MFKASLVLEGGGLRGIYTAGVLDAFLDRNFEFDTVVGSSAGACNGSRFVAKDHGAMKNIDINLMSGPNYCGMKQFFKKGTYINMDYLFETVPFELQVFPFKVYNESKTKFFSVVTRLFDGKPDYLEKSKYPGIDPIRASSSLPLASTIVKIDGEMYMDGGLADPIPYAKGLAHNDKCVIVLTRPKGFVKKRVKNFWLLKRMYESWPEFLNVIKTRHQHYNEQLREIEDLQAAGKAFVICPSGDVNIGRLKAKKERLEEIYQMGYDDALGQMEALCTFLEESNL